MPRATGSLPWIPLLAAGMNPEETSLFRKKLTGETHKAEGKRVRGVREEWRKCGVSTTWERSEPLRMKRSNKGTWGEGWKGGAAKRYFSILQIATLEQEIKCQRHKYDTPHIMKVMTICLTEQTLPMDTL